MFGLLRFQGVKGLSHCLGLRAENWPSFRISDVGRRGRVQRVRVFRAQSFGGGLRFLGPQGPFLSVEHRLLQYSLV